MREKCPHCGNDDTYSYKVYGLVDYRTGAFGLDGYDESGEIRETRPWPTYAKCNKCGKRIRLRDLENTPNVEGKAGRYGGDEEG